MLFDILKAKSNIILDNLLMKMWKKKEKKEIWETLYENSNKSPNPNTPYNFFWINSMNTIYPTEGSVWRITINDVVYKCTAIEEDDLVYIGNPKYSRKTDNGSDAIFSFYNSGVGAWLGDTELPVASYKMKIEHLVIS